MRRIFDQSVKTLYPVLTSLLLSMTLLPSSVKAATTEEDKLSLEEQILSELNATQGADQSGNQKSKVKPDEMEIIESQGAQKSIADEDLIEVFDIPADAISETEFESGSKQVRYIDQAYLTNGFSYGATMLNHNYNVVANLMLNGSYPFDASKKTADFQSVGGLVRYAIMPYDSLGTDINITLASSLNHSNINSSAIFMAKAEVNLGYSMLAGNLPIYFLAGLGSEVLNGSDIESLVSKNGAGFQLGTGVVLGKKFHFEFMYSYMRHAISDKYLETVSNLALANGAVSVKYDNNEANGNSNILMGRITYSY